MKKRISRGELIPPFYGIAYRDYDKDLIICYPIFINLIIILYRDFKFWLKNPKGNIP